MKSKIFLFAIALFVSLQLFGQESIVFNKDYAWSKDDKSVTIHFDLAVYAPHTFYEVSFIATLNGKKVKAITTKGDIGKYIESGEGKRITWDITADVGELKTTDVLTVDVVARKVKTKTKTVAKTNKLPKIMKWSGIGLGALTAGYGVYVETQAKSDYNIYKDNTDKESQIYTDLQTTRKELYDDANRRHKTAQTLMIAGGAVVLAGVVLLIFKKSPAKVYKDISVIPMVIPQYTTTTGSFKPQFNMVVAMKF